MVVEVVGGLWVWDWVGGGRGRGAGTSSATSAIARPTACIWPRVTLQPGEHRA